MPREIIRPEYNQPCVFKLGHPPAIVEGIRGHQWRYFVNNDEAMLYLDAPAKEAIDACGAKAGDEVALTKTRQGRSTVWSADLVEDEPVPVEMIAGEPPVMMTPYDAAAEARNRQRAIASRTQAPPANRKKVAAPVLVNGNGNGHHAPPPAAPPAAPLTPPAPVREMPPHRPGAKLLAMALFAAIDAAKLAEDYARQQGLTLQFTSEDVRTMANTLRMEERGK